MLRLFAVTCVAVMLAAQSCSLEEPGSELRKDESKPKGAEVIRAVDGDTLLVKAGGREVYVRVIGLDSPESVQPGVPVECGGLEASDSMKVLAPEGSEVELIVDRSQDRIDRYGRLLRYAEISGRDVGEVQVKRGWAEPYVYDAEFGRLDRYEAAAEQAEGSASGVWGACGGDFHSGGRLTWAGSKHSIEEVRHVRAADRDDG